MIFHSTSLLMTMWLTLLKHPHTGLVTHYKDIFFTLLAPYENIAHFKNLITAFHHCLIVGTVAYATLSVFTTHTHTPTHAHTQPCMYTHTHSCTHIHNTTITTYYNRDIFIINHIVWYCNRLLSGITCYVQC